MKPDIRKHPQTGEPIYFYSISQLEDHRNKNEKIAFSRSARKENPYQPIGGSGRRKDTYGNHA